MARCQRATKSFGALDESHRTERTGRFSDTAVPNSGKKVLYLVCSFPKGVHTAAASFYSFHNVECHLDEELHFAGSADNSSHIISSK